MLKLNMHTDAKIPKLRPAALSSNDMKTRVRGKAYRVRMAHIDGRTIVTTGKWLRLAIVQDEDLIEREVVADPTSFILHLKETRLNADMFTFAQKMPDTTPKYPYYVEWDNVAIIPVVTFSEWWEKCAESSVRRAVRKAAKSGVTVRIAEFDDAMVEGIVRINNETRIRQGRPFWHFQKDFAAVKRENGTYTERNVFLGAYYEGELIGFIRLTSVGDVANIVQFLTMMKHYDKRPANALIAKAVEVCEQRGFQYLMYCKYVYNDPKSSLTEFKRRHGFQQVLVPRYYVPLTFKGRVALQLGLHRGLVARIPKSLVSYLLTIRSLWYARRFKVVKGEA
jgi:hypothetical protein